MSPVEPTRRDRKSTQRERLLEAMVELAARDGFAAATIARVIGQAGVSRPTFYDYFPDRDACFIAALADVQQLLLADVRRAVEREAPELALEAAIVALVEFAGSRPAMARVAMSEALGAGVGALDVRDRGIAAIAEVVEQAEQRAPSTAAVPDICASALIGGVSRMLATRLRRGEPSTSALRQDLLRWVARYERPAAVRDRHTLELVALAEPAPPNAALLAPPPLPPGRPRVASEEVLYAQRLRILLATAEVASEKGCAATTIAEITKRAGIDGRALYRQFANKQEVFAAVHELFFQHLVALTASGFFTGESWPERVWKAMETFAGVLESNPTLAYFEFVESHAVGPLAMQRFNDATAAFTIFLQEGFQQRQANPPSQLSLEAIVATSFEVFYRQIRRRVDAPLAALTPQLARLSLVPFIGALATEELIEKKLEGTGALVSGFGPEAARPESEIETLGFKQDLAK
jgi:AcrR family transcriptional regulator